jgi:hypothetical protein
MTSVPEPSPMMGEGWEGVREKARATFVDEPLRFAQWVRSAGGKLCTSLESALRCTGR